MKTLTTLGSPTTLEARIHQKFLEQQNILVLYNELHKSITDGTSLTLLLCFFQIINSYIIPIQTHKYRYLCIFGALILAGLRQTDAKPATVSTGYQQGISWNKSM